VPWLRRLVAGLLAQSPGFDPIPLLMWFVIDKVALTQGFLGIPTHHTQVHHLPSTLCNVSNCQRCSFITVISWCERFCKSVANTVFLCGNRISIWRQTSDYCIPSDNFPWLARKQSLPCLYEALYVLNTLVFPSCQVRIDSSPDYSDCVVIHTHK